jgi:hypothetical protein
MILKTENSRRVVESRYVWAITVCITVWALSRKVSNVIVIDVKIRNFGTFFASFLFTAQTKSITSGMDVDSSLFGLR